MKKEFKPYFEKLKDPRWQKKRLQIMQDARFECQNCGNANDTLNVHHIVYFKNCEPWEYLDKYLKCLCDKCHKDWHEKRQKFLKGLADIEADGLGLEEVEWLVIWKIDREIEALNAIFECLEYDRKLYKDVSEAFKAGRIK